MSDYKSWLELIRDIAYDRDGYTTAEDLGNLVDELHNYSVKALKNEPCIIVKDIV